MKIPLKSVDVRHDWQERVRFFDDKYLATNLGERYRSNLLCRPWRSSTLSRCPEPQNHIALWPRRWKKQKTLEVDTALTIGSESQFFIPALMRTVLWKRTLQRVFLYVSTLLRSQSTTKGKSRGLNLLPPVVDSSFVSVYR